MLNFATIKTAAIIGASEDPKKIGNILLERNTSYQGEIYGVNPKGGSAHGRKFYPSISSLPSVPDIAVFTIPAALIPDSLEEAGKFGIKKAIIITAGFKEVGNQEGEQLIQTIANRYGIRVLGPNCLGYGDTAKGLNLSFGGKFFSPGSIGIISQSGAMAVAITDILTSQKLGFSQFYSLGNKSDIDESELLLELLADRNTHVIALYLEGIAHGERFLDTLKKVTKEKPVVVMMGGMSNRGKIATASHTGSLSGNRTTLEAVFAQGGAHLTYSLEDFISLLEVYDKLAGRKLHGKPFLITNAGGPGVLATDQAEFHGVELASITPDMETILRENMPAVMSTKNPIDIIGDADSNRVHQVLENICNITEEADILFLFTVQATTDIDTIAITIADFYKRKSGFRVFVTLIGGDTVTHAHEMLHDAGIPTMNTPESLISLYSTILGQKKKESIVSKDPHTQTVESILLNQNDTTAILGDYGIVSTAMTESDSLEAILKYARQYTAPYIMKVGGKHIAHKTELGGVLGPLHTEDELKKAFQTLSGKGEGSVTIGRYIKSNPSIELFFGAKRDKNFGDIYVVGMGGIHVSLHDDARLHVGGWSSREEIEETLFSLRIAPVLSGYRGQKMVDIGSLADMILSLIRLFSEHEEISGIDINPILFDDGKACIADAKFYLSK